MPIHDIIERAKSPILGKIRLGIRKESQKGSLYPSEVEYFVLKDAQEVEKVYGPEPKELDVFFTDDNLDNVIPTWYRFYMGGFQDKSGNFVGGKIQCRGDGIKAVHYAKKDPVTGIAPERPCLKDKCPDWLDEKGNQKCKQGMNVLAVIPRVQPWGVYQIDTTSWNSIRSFWELLMNVQSIRGTIKGFPFKIVRERMEVRHFDKKSGTEKVSFKHIMKLKPNEEFLARYGQAVLERIKVNALPSPDEVIRSPMEDHMPLRQLEESGSSGMSVGEISIDPATELAEHPEFIQLYGQLAQVIGGDNNPKKRLIAVNSKMAVQSNLTLEELKGMIQKAIDVAIAKKTPAPTPEPLPPPVSTGPADGII